jgi:hypothetical protein
MDFLFVRWFGRDSDPQPGWKSRRLIRLGFVPGNDGSAFGFLDPNQVIRAIHLIPAFHWGRVTTKYLPRSPIARGIDDPDHDWQLFYIGMFVFYLLIYNQLITIPRFRFADRDLMMRFRGGGVGHKTTRQATNFFKKDRHTSDVQNSMEPTSDIVEELEEMNDSEESEKMEGSSESDVEDDYGYQLGEDQSDSEEEKSSEDDLEFEDGDLGPEDDGRAVDSDMEELGYAEL